MRINAPDNVVITSRFNPRTRDGCEVAKAVAAYNTGVSIHAPVMGAKKTDEQFDTVTFVSIHAPVMGANCPSLLHQF